MQQVDELEFELSNMSVHNPVYILKINTLLAELRKKVSQGNANALHYRKILNKYAGKYRKLNLWSLDVVNSAISYFGSSSCSVTLPISEYLSSCDILSSLYQKAFSEKVDTPETVKQFLYNRVAEFRQFSTNGSQEFWDMNANLTTYIISCKRKGLLDISLCEQEFRYFIALKRFAIKLKGKLFNKIDDDIMRCFGDNLVLYDQIDVEKLKVLYCFLTGHDISDAVKSFEEKFYDSKNPLHLRADVRDKAYTDFMGYVYSFESEENLTNLLEYAYNDERVFDFLPHQTKLDARNFIFRKISVVSDEELQAFMINYITDKAISSNVDWRKLFQECFGDQRRFIDSDATVMNKINRLIMERGAKSNETEGNK